MSPAATRRSASGGMLTSSLPSASTSAATPSRIRPPGSSTRTRRPRVAHKPVYSARRPDRSGSPKTRDHVRYLRSRPARIPASNRVRSSSGEPSRRSEGAGRAPRPGTRASRSALVEPVPGTPSTARHRPRGRTTAARTAASSRGASSTAASSGGASSGGASSTAASSGGASSGGASSGGASSRAASSGGASSGGASSRAASSGGASSGGASSRGGSVTDAHAHAAETLALALDLDHLDAADLAGGGDVGAAVGLLVQADDVDDPDLLDLRRHQVGAGTDDVGQGERLVAGQHAHVDAPARAALGVAGRPTRVPEARRAARDAGAAA